MIKKMGKKNKIVLYLAVVMLVLGLLFSLSKSYAYFETKVAGSNVTLGVGKLIHSLNSDVKLKSGAKKEINLFVKSNDEVASKYQVYYTSSDDLTGVSVGYSSDSIDLPSGEIEARGVKSITIVLENDSSNDISIEIGVRGGLAKNTVEDIILETGENRVVNVMNGVSEDDLVCDTTGTATSADITEGKTAWINGELVTGTRPAPVNSQSGSKYILAPGKNLTGTSGDYSAVTYHAIEFPVAFDTVPEVTVTYSGEERVVCRGVRNVTKVGCEFIIASDRGGQYGITVYWTAIAK